MTLENAIESIVRYSLHHRCSDTYVFYDLTSAQRLLVAIIKDGGLYIEVGWQNMFDLLLKKECSIIANDLHVKGDSYAL